jgi:hypothetical protein
MSDWQYCELLERVRGNAIRVLEYNPEEQMYREMVYSSERDLDALKGEVYE